MNDKILEKYPDLKNLSLKKEYMWINPEINSVKDILPGLSISMEDILDAEARLSRFAPLLQNLFPELKYSNGIIESEITEIRVFKDRLYNDFKSRILLKTDHALPVAGSVKARGGIYEVLLFAENKAIEEGLFKIGDSYLRFLDQDIKDIFKEYTISVGSTGNLGLSIGITASALGFKSKVHMSFEAKEWKKQRLRDRGVEVVEHRSDYTKAVYEGRIAAEKNPNEYFVDDENSLPLFLGYSVAAIRLKKQLEDVQIKVDKNHPLFVYLPCGVGGAPCGIAFGLKNVFGDYVHCFLAEPVESPCMTIGLITDFKDDLSVYDIGLNNNTSADGLAVSAPSILAGGLIKNLISGCFTVKDETLHQDLTDLYKLENIALEPSAAAGFRGPIFLEGSNPENFPLKGIVKSKNTTHIIWTTGGLFVPENEFKVFLR